MYADSSLKTVVLHSFQEILVGGTTFTALKSGIINKRIDGLSTDVFARDYDIQISIKTYLCRTGLN
ncbi:MAG: hypothetical protein ACLS9K_09045 [Lachnospira eligens]